MHNASILNAVGVCGLQLYSFGETVSLVFFTDTWRPDSFYEKVAANRKAGLHTLCLLDIKVKEPSLESLARGKKEYEPARFMRVNDAIEQLLEVEEKRKEGGEPATPHMVVYVPLLNSFLWGKVYSRDTLCVGLARIGQKDQKIVYGQMEELRSVDFGPPLHSLILPGKTHFHEEEVLNLYRFSSQAP